MEKQCKKMTYRIAYFDVARSLLMLWIVGLWHLSDYAINSPLFLNGANCTLITYGVLATFSYISGWFAAKANNEEEFKLKNLLRYYFDRISRIYPLYIIAVILFFVFGLLSADQLLPSILLYFEFTDKAPITIWYIGVLFVYYFFAPFIASINNFFLKILMCVMLNAGGMIGVQQFGWDKRLTFYFLFFWLGMCNFSISHALNKVDSEKFSSKLLLVALYFILPFFIRKIHKLELNIYTTLFCFFVIIIIMEISKILCQIKLIAKVAYFISYSSMCVYLFHRIIYKVSSLLLGKFHFISAFLILFPMTIAMCYSIQKMYNKIILVISKIRIIHVER